MTIPEIALPLFIIFLALWRRDVFFYLVAGPVAFVLGLMWRPAYPNPDGFAVSLALIGLGIYCFIMGIYNLLRKAKIMGD